MVNFSRSLRHVKAHLDQLVPERTIHQICRQLGHPWRKRLLTPAATVHLFLLQLLANVAMEGLRHVAKITVSASAICQAKQRLPLQLLMRLVEHMVEYMEHSVSQTPAASLWKGLAVYLADGMSFLVPDKPQLAHKFGKSKNQRGISSGYPVPKLLALMDFTGGFIHKVITLPSARQEFTCLSRLFKSIIAGAIGGFGGLLLGDRGLVSFVHLALLINAGLEGCFRLPRGQVVFDRARKSRRCVKRLGRQDKLVCWQATRCPNWLSQKRWKKLASQQLLLRQIAYRVYRKGFRVQWAWIITTLTDPQKYPAQELIELYNKRWQIEVYFRDLKRTLGMELLSAQTVEGVRKEILCFILLYNLIRQVMNQAARSQGTTADRISFIDALRWLLWSSPGQPIPTLKVNPQRIRRSPPRKIKRGRHRFAQLNGNPQDQSKPACCVKL